MFIPNSSFIDLRGDIFDIQRNQQGEYDLWCWTNYPSGWCWKGTSATYEKAFQSMVDMGLFQLEWVGFFDA